MSLPRLLPKFIALAGLLTISALIVGCGPGSGDISGKVTYKGVPLKGGEITFLGEDGGLSYPSPINEDGTFHATGVREGKYKVIVDTEMLKPNTSGKKMQQGPQQGSKYGPKGPSGPPGKTDSSDPVKDIKSRIPSPPPEGEAPHNSPNATGFDRLEENLRRYIQIPNKYARGETTPLRYTATRGSQSQTFELSDD